MQQIALRLAAGQTNLSPGRLCILANQGRYAEPPGGGFSFPTPTKQDVACYLTDGVPSLEEPEPFRAETQTQFMLSALKLRWGRL